MILDRHPEIAALLRAASRGPLVLAGERRGGETLDRSTVESLLPHRAPFLFVDRVARVDRKCAAIVCDHDIAAAAKASSGHSSGEPVWPAVLHVEAIGQAGLCLHRILHDRRRVESGTRLALTDILGACFLRPIAPGDRVEIVARVVYDGLFTIFVGQCLQRGWVCSAAAVRGIDKEVDA